MANKTGFYDQLQSRLSQGDVVREVPWGIVGDPIVECRPVDAKKARGKASYGPMSSPKVGKILNIHAKVRIGCAMVLWHDCQIDKFDNQGKPVDKWFAAVAPIMPIPTGDAGVAIAEGNRKAFFPIPKYPAIGIIEPSYVDLRYIWPVKQTILQNRIGTLSEDAKLSLYFHLFRFLSQKEWSGKLECPQCSHPLFE